MRQTMITLTVLVAAAALVAVLSGPAVAKVTGVCSNCHTMHNSQGGNPMTNDGSPTPNGVLLKGNCVGCHAQAGADHVVAAGNIPQVYHTSATDLAGGNFGYIDQLGGSKGSGASDTKGHNVIAAISALTDDGNLAAPPGDEFTTGITSGVGGNFTCAGAKGCHGDRSVEDGASSLSGAHHGDDSTIDGSTVPGSYRFLLGVKGVENNDATNPWENLSLAKHNKYQGKDGPDTATLTSPGTAGTISGLCAECHGTFHGTGADGHGSPSAWIRHPTDILLPNTPPYDGYVPTTTYDPIVPVAYTDPVSGESRATAVVMCLSCHGVHGTDYDDILRWDYSAMNAGNGGAASDTGCFRCHMDKD